MDLEDIGLKLLQNRNRQKILLEEEKELIYQYNRILTSYAEDLDMDSLEYRDFVQEFNEAVRTVSIKKIIEISEYFDLIDARPDDDHLYRIVFLSEDGGYGGEILGNDPWVTRTLVIYKSQFKNPNCLYKNIELLEHL
jgi:hypothetical protein